MNGAVEILKRERDAAADQVRTLRARIRELEAAICLLEGQVGLPKPKSDGDLKTRVEAIVRDANPPGISPKEISEKLTSSGRVTSEASVSSTLSRLKADKRVANQHGTWFAAKEAASEAKTSEAESE